MQSILPKSLLLALALSAAWSASISSLQAQTFAAPLQATGNSPMDFEFRADGTMIAKGAMNTGSLLSTDQGAGTRLLWFPARAAFRAGNVQNRPVVWSLANIGQYSVAFGLDTTASGPASMAFGSGTTASAPRSAAFGDGSVASGAYSVAFGASTTASGWESMASGASVTASGDDSAAFGTCSLASGDDTFTAGNGTIASGYASAAFGDSTTASTYGSFAVGICNVGGGDPTNAADTDPLFEVGNGSPVRTSDALVVCRSGDATFKGVVTVAAGGDIPMYTGN